MNKDFARGMIVSMALKALPVRKKSPIAYLYNGVRLPALPEWDREEYPYAFIHQTYTMSGPVWELNATKEIVYNGENIGINGGSVRFNTDVDNPTKWAQRTTHSDGLICARTKVMWANFDVMGENGAVVLEKSTPIPIYNEPVNYLYNGVKLPKLPEWDKTVYPYAVIYQNQSSGATYCVATSEPVDIENLWCLGGANGGVAKLLTQINEVSAWDDFAETENQVLGTLTNVFLWSNHNCYDSSDNLKLEASEPVPIYE